MAKKKAADVAANIPMVPEAFTEITDEDWARAIAAKSRGICDNDSREYAYTVALSIIRVIYHLDVMAEAGRIDLEQSSESIQELANELASVLTRDY